MLPSFPSRVERRQLLVASLVYDPRSMVKQNNLWQLAMTGKDDGMDERS